MIGRIWRGWAHRETADAYEKLLTSTVLPSLSRVDGYEGSYFLRRDAQDGEVEFVEITFWRSMDSILAFAGPEPTRAVVPEETQLLLTRFDTHSVHYEATWCP